MRIDLRNTYLSKPRYNRYLNATGNDIKRAKRLYNANIRLAQSIHPLLTQFEVALRNSLNIHLASYFGDSNWILTQKNGFMHDKSLSRSKYFLRKSVLKSERKLIQKGIPMTGGKIISDQAFGFWIALFLSHHYSLIGGQPIKVFSNKPPSENRASLYNKLNEIRKFRNRVNHCEPICFKGANVDCTVILEMRSTLYDLVYWMEPDLVPFLEDLDNVQNKVNRTMLI